MHEITMPRYSTINFDSNIERPSRKRINQSTRRYSTRKYQSARIEQNYAIIAHIVNCIISGSLETRSDFGNLKYHLNNIDCDQLIMLLLTIGKFVTDDNSEATSAGIYFTMTWLRTKKHILKDFIYHIALMCECKPMITWSTMHNASFENALIKSFHLGSVRSIRFIERQATKYGEIYTEELIRVLTLYVNSFDWVNDKVCVRSVMNIKDLLKTIVDRNVQESNARENVARSAVYGNVGQLGADSDIQDNISSTGNIQVQVESNNLVNDYFVLHC